MPKTMITADGTWNTGVPGGAEVGYRLLSYTGTLGGATLRVLSTSSEGVTTPVADGKLNAAKTDDNGDLIQQMLFQTIGNILVVTSGATVATDLTVSVE